jgi:hypothetical protein
MEDTTPAAMEDTTDPSLLFPTVFSPSKYGADDALMLNSLQWVMADPRFSRPFRSVHTSLLIGFGATSRLFAQPSGSLLEADYLTLHFAHYPNDLYYGQIHWVLVNSATREVDNVSRAIALVKLFVPGFVPQCGGDSVSAQYTEVYYRDWNLQDVAAEGVTGEVMRLRERLYRRPRAVAFMSGLHGEGSIVQSLSDDLCKRILELSFAE